MNIQVFGEDELVERVQKGETYYSHCISIRNPEQVMPEVIRSGFQDVLELKFYDVTDPDQLGPMQVGKRVPELRDAKAIVDFYNATHHVATGYTIHCWHGHSRSTAAALALLYLILGSEQAAGERLLEIRPEPVPSPNQKLVEHFDTVLGTTLLAVAKELQAKWIAKLRQELIDMRPVVEIDGPIEDLPVVEDEEKGPKGERRPVKIILDTDIGPDCDDAGAIAVLHALADLGEVEILGMTCCTSSKWGPACIQAINTYYGRPEIVIGAYDRPGVLEEDRWSSYNKYVATNFPNAKRAADLFQAPPACMVMRELLVHHRNVTIVGIGPLTNLADLLDSPPDYYSPLTGRALIAQSVDKLVQMGGGFPRGEEFNFVTRPTATKRVVDRWPTEIVFSGIEIGGKLSAGEQLMRTPRTNPVRMAYKLHTQGWMQAFAFDHTAVIYAARGALYWTLSRRGRCQVGSTGENSWRSRPFGRHRYLVAKTPAGELSAIIESLMIRFPKLARHEDEPREDEVLVEELPVVPDEST